MKVLNICVDDYANFSHDNANALRSVGVHCVDVKLQPHVFNYKTESTLANESILKELIAEAELVQIFHSDSSLIKYCSGKRLVVYHTGTRYRQNHQKFNALFNPHVEKSFVALGEFYGLGAKNEQYIVGATKVHGQKPLHFIHPLRFAHFPSNPEVKGTQSILNAVESINHKNFRFEFSLDKVSHDQQISRMNSCDVYIEMNSTHQGGKPYGSWGITTLEATSLGKIVITNHTTLDVYEKTYGITPPLVLIEKHGSIEACINNLLSLTESQIHLLKKQSFEWLEKFHSFEATGSKLKQILSL